MYTYFYMLLFIYKLTKIIIIANYYYEEHNMEVISEYY